VKKGLQILTDLSCPPYTWIREKFDKVIYNLLSNAMKFTSAGGKLQSEPAGGSLFVTGKDTGIGIRTEQIPHLFQRFHQAEGSPNRSYEGSGLGLALVKNSLNFTRGKFQWSRFTKEARLQFGCKLA